MTDDLYAREQGFTSPTMEEEEDNNNNTVSNNAHPIPAGSEEGIAGLGQDPATSTSTTNPDTTKVQNGLKARKRTKTGCLTCRKRRIKCGEERPTCANCIKSKRSCEGYAPRLTFKDPIGAYRSGWAAKGNDTQYQNLPHHNGIAGQYRLPNPGTGAQNQLPAIAPRPLPPGSRNGMFHSLDGATSTWPGAPYSSTQRDAPIANISSSDLPPRMRAAYRQQDNSSYGTPALAQRALPPNGQHTQPYLSSLQDQVSASLEPNRRYSLAEATQARPQVSTSDAAPAEYIQAQAEYTPTSSVSGSSMPQLNTDQELVPGNLGQQIPLEFAEIPSPPQLLHSGQLYTPATTDSTNLENYNWTPQQELSPTVHTSSGYVGQITSTSGFTPPSTILEDNLGYPKPWPRISQRQLPPPPDDGDDDYYDVESDEDAVPNPPYIATTPQNDLGLLLALSASQDDRAIRSYTAFLHHSNILSTYQPTFTASPLMDATTARIFCHFITATGPSLSIFERHPMNPSVMFTGRPVPKSQQALWTYTLPMLALSNQGLLHAMLALASLHISKLQSTPPTSSLKHYHFALRRVSKAVATPSKRTDIATIAATLVLGHYEASTAEHSKWNSHLAGARQLLMEIDFKGMTKHIKDEKARREARYGSWQDPYNSLTQKGQLPELYTSKEDEIDETIVSSIMGWKVRYDEFGRVVEDEQGDPMNVSITEKDIENHHVYTDLFWFYCKLDVYQCLISGNRLLMPYDRWGHCPPRGPISRLDAIYGTLDHLVLLMGRISDFAAKDSARKRKAVEANGGQWRPPPGMFPSPPPGTSRGPPGGMPPGMPPGPPGGMPSGMAGSTPPFGQGPPPGAPNGSPQTSTPQQPPVYGMMPPQPQREMPNAFTQAPRDKIFIPTAPEEDQDLAAATAAAEKEWHDIVAALDLFEACLGPGWAPLSTDHTPPIATPFGPAIQYRTYSISCIWVLFYVGRIVSKRMHPSMPPAAMTAAAVAAAQTAEWANTLGRIACGLYLPPPNQPLNPNLGAALMESTLGLFFGGIQYTDPIQRSQTVTRLRAIADMSGFQSAALIAAGCETCWIKMAQAGRGPPYERTHNPRATDYREAGKRPPKGDEHDRTMVAVNPGTRVHWAMGIMSLDEDFRDMRLVRKG